MSPRKGNEYNKSSKEGKPMRVMEKSGKASWEEESEKGSEGWIRWKQRQRKKKAAYDKEGKAGICVMSRPSNRGAGFLQCGTERWKLGNKVDQHCNGP